MSFDFSNCFCFKWELEIIFFWHRKQQDEPLIRAFIRDTVKPNYVDSVEFYTIGNIDLETISVTPSLSKVKEFKKYKGDRFNIFNKLQSRLKSMKKKN